MEFYADIYLCGGIKAIRFPEGGDIAPRHAKRGCAMDFGWFAGLTVFAFAMAATPGPNNAMVTASGMAYGIVRTLPLLAGIGIGVGAIMLTVAAFGSSAITDPRVGAVLRWLGVLYLSWLAWKIASAEPEPKEPDASRPATDMPLSFMQGVFFQFVNPKLWVMVSGAVLTYGQAASGVGRIGLAILFAFVFGTITFISTVAWTALGAWMGRLVPRRSVRAFNIAMAALLLASLIPVILG